MCLFCVKVDLIGPWFLENISIFKEEKDSAKKKWDHRQCWGAHFWRHYILKGQTGDTGGTTKKRFNLLVQILMDLKSQNNFSCFY